MTSSRMTAILVALALAAVLTGCKERRDPGFQGWVEADMIFVSPDESGRVTKLNVREGDEVKPGMQIYSVDDELQKAGILRFADGLKPSSQGKRVAFDGAGRTVIDGPFAQPRELVAGFWLWEVKDMDEAVAWAKRCPNPMPGPSEIEIRPLYEMDDLRAES